MLHFHEGAASTSVHLYGCSSVQSACSLTLLCQCRCFTSTATRFPSSRMSRSWLLCPSYRSSLCTVTLSLRVSATGSMCHTISPACAAWTSQQSPGWIGRASQVTLEAMRSAWLHTRDALVEEYIQCRHSSHVGRLPVEYFVDEELGGVGLQGSAARTNKSGLERACVSRGMGCCRGSIFGRQRVGYHGLSCTSSSGEA